MTTLTLLHYPGFRNRRFGFWTMRQNIVPKLRSDILAGSRVEGLTFNRIMGSGAGNGFSLRPNWSVYAWLGHWESTAAADAFFAEHPWWREIKQHSDYRMTFRLAATMTHGTWGGQKPFTAQPDDYDPSEPVAVITRATIRPHKLLDFWRYVPQTSASIHDHPERLISIGIGEYPVFMQATFSLWTSGAAMQRFAYRSQHHKEVVQLTRERNWYKEEQFTRFRVLGMEGEWPGLDRSVN